MIHERFCCNRRSAATTSLRPAGSSLGPSPYCTSTHRALAAPRAGLAARLSDFATNFHESCGLDCTGGEGALQEGAKKFSSVGSRVHQGAVL